MSIAVFSGMLWVTFFGLFLTPVFYVVPRTLEKCLTGRMQLVNHSHRHGHEVALLIERTARRGEREVAVLR